MLTLSDQGCNFVRHWQILVDHCLMTDNFWQPCTVIDVLPVTFNSIDFIQSICMLLPLTPTTRTFRGNKNGSSYLDFEFPEVENKWHTKSVLTLKKKDGKAWWNLKDPELQRHIFVMWKRKNTRLLQNKFKVSDYSTTVIIFTYHNLTNVVRVIEGIIVWKMTWREIKIASIYWEAQVIESLSCQGKISVNDERNSLEIDVGSS